MRTALGNMGIDRRLWWRGFTRGPWAAFALVLVCIALYVPGQWGMPAIDRDESRFAQASRQMMASETWHGWMVPRVQDRLRLNKPPLIYWMQGGSASVFSGRAMGKSAQEAIASDAIWMYRLPSLLAAMAAVLFTWRLGCSMFDSRAGFLGALLFAASPVIIWEARQARADMVLVACSTAAIWGLWEAWKQVRARGVVRPVTWIGLWLAVGLGSLTKGPITAMIVLLTVVSLSVMTRRWKWVGAIKPLMGALIVEGIVVPWVMLVVDQVGFENYLRIVLNETLGRIREAKEGHWGPPGYHLVLMPVLLGAGSILVWPALVRAWRVGTSSVAGRRIRSLRMGRPAEAFLLCVVIPSWIVFELAGTKLPHYTMPFYPALALLAARAVMSADAGRWKFGWPRLVKALAWVWLGAVAAALVAFGLLATFAAWRSWGSIASACVGAMWLMGAGVLAFWGGSFLKKDRWLHAQRIGIAMMVGLSLALGVVGHALPEIRVSRQLANELDRIDPDHTRPMIAVQYTQESEPGARDWGGYVEDSLIFETGGQIKRFDASKPAGALLEWVASNPDGLICIEAQALKRYGGLSRDSKLESIGPRVKDLNILGMVPGFNYTKGKLVFVFIAEPVR